MRAAGVMSRRILPWRITDILSKEMRIICSERERDGNTTKVKMEENPRNIRFYLLAIAGKEINLAYLNSGGQVLAFAVAGGFDNV